MANRRVGKLHRTQIRISEKDYERIQIICENMDITMADYFNNLIHHDGYDNLLWLAKSIKKDPRKVEISYPDETTGERIDNLIKTGASVSEQTKKIGYNISSLIRDIRLGRVNANHIKPLIKEMETMLETLQEQAKDCNRMANELDRLMRIDEGIEIVEIRMKYGGID